MLPPTLIAAAIRSVALPAALLGFPIPRSLLAAPEVLVPSSLPFGKSYSEWGAAWWAYTFSLPTRHHPFFDTAPLETGQSGPVWFLGGTFQGSGPTHRKGTVPPGTALFFPIITNAGDNTGCPEPSHLTEAEFIETLKGFQDGARNLACSVDGVPIQGLGDPLRTLYRAVSRSFSYTAPAKDNFLDVVLGQTCYRNENNRPYPVSGACADGVYVMLAPLPAGTHAIKFSGSLPEFGLVEDVSYLLTVLPLELKGTLDDDQWTLRWPRTSAPYVLESASRLDSPDWEPVDAPVQATDTGYQASIPAQTGPRFFRLHLE